VLGSGIILTTLIGAALGRWVTHRVISPVRQLAGRVMALSPEDGHRPLAGDYPQDEVGELALAFDRYVERIRGFIERERAFTADLSHELRTPLTVISGAAEVLLADSALAPAVRRRVERIQRAEKEMAEMIPALLALARESEQGASAPSASVAEALGQEVDTNAHLLAGKPVEVQLQIDRDERLRVEPALLRSVLGNLIRNAFIYTQEGRILLRLDRRLLTIEDTGPGIPADEIERIFRRYYVAGDSHGSGIGLSLVKRICERYGWSIRLRSTPTIGTVIEVEFGPPPAD
jgi:signal transduction histidine kinase